MTSTGKLTKVIVRDKAGRFMERFRDETGQIVDRTADHIESNPIRRPGRFKEILTVGPEFFEPLTDEEILSLSGI